MNPNTSAATTRMMLGAAESILPPGWTLRGRQAEHGVPMITDRTGLPVAAAEVVRIGLSEASGVDAIVVAAFADPGAATLREHLSIPIIG
ncbi:MAG: aspartate/glutamate racemase family protein, partial [Rhodospirillales bacterium]